MKYIRRATDRGTTDLGWLQSRHSFSFGGYHEPAHMGFSALRVINDDVVAPAAGFGTHGHRDMEIVSYVLEGALRHEDSSGNSYVVPAGEIQLMSAGAGIMHSEHNNSAEQSVRFLQIWIEPNQRGTRPDYAQQPVTQLGRLTPLVSADGRAGSLIIRQNMTLSRLVLEANDNVELSPSQGKGYLHLLEGGGAIAGTTLSTGDALGFEESNLLQAETALQALYFDLPG